MVRILDLLHNSGFVSFRFFLSRFSTSNCRSNINFRIWPLQFESKYARGLFLFLLFLHSATVAAATVSVSAEIQQSGAYEQQPLKGTITVTHSKDDAVDTESFQLEKKKLAVDFVKDVRISPTDPTVLSIYSFQISGQPAGLYALSPVSVHVGSGEYKSFLSSYTVQAKTSSQQVPAHVEAKTISSEDEIKATLRIEAFVDGKSSLFPGQHTKFVYRYYFHGNIGLTEENLPLHDAEGFVKIGEKEITDTSEGNVSINQIVQEVESVKPGSYSFGPSVVEGHAYKNDAQGHPVYTSSKLTSEAPAVVVTVLPFPEKNKPASFNGAVGNYTFKTELVSPSSVEVGNEISLALLISGKGNLKGVPTPDLCCQPGFSGFFKQSDLPPNEDVSQGLKKSEVKLRVLTDQIKEIPSVEFSFFDPDASDYVILHSQPIPIKVTAAAPTPLPAMNNSIPKRSPEKNHEKISNAVSPIEIESIVPLQTADLYNKPFGTWWTFAIVPIALALLLYQSQYKKFLDWRRSQFLKERSDVLFAEAFAVEGKCDFRLLKRALILALVESGNISLEMANEESLPSDGVAGKVKTLLSLLEEKRFGGEGDLQLNDVRVQAEKIMKEVMHANGI